MPSFQACDDGRSRPLFLPAWLRGCHVAFSLSGLINHHHRAAHDRMQLAVIAVPSGGQRSDKDTAIRRRGNGLKRARLVRRTTIMAHTMRRSREIEPPNGSTSGHDRNGRLVVGRGAFQMMSAGATIRVAAAAAGQAESRSCEQWRNRPTSKECAPSVHYRLLFRDRRALDLASQDSSGRHKGSIGGSGRSYKESIKKRS